MHLEAHIVAGVLPVHLIRDLPEVRTQERERESEQLGRSPEAVETGMERRRPFGELQRGDSSDPHDAKLGQAVSGHLAHACGARQDLVEVATQLDHLRARKYAANTGEAIFPIALDPGSGGHGSQYSNDAAHCRSLPVCAPQRPYETAL